MALPKPPPTLASSPPPSTPPAQRRVPAPEAAEAPKTPATAEVPVPEPLVTPEVPVPETTAVIDTFPQATSPQLTSSRPGFRVFKRVGSIILTLLLWILIFSAGNLGTYFGIVDIGRAFEIRNPQAQSAASPDQVVASAQLASRLDEVAAALDTTALYSYTQGDLDTATTAAIRALIETSGDDYAYYFTPEEYAAYLKSSEGEYVGIGIVLTTIDDKVTVFQVYDASPAAEVGMKAGDTILSVDGDRHDWTVDEVIEAVRRPSGEGIRMVWSRDGAEHMAFMTVREVNIPTSTTHLIEHDGASIGYIYLRRFNTHSASDLRTALGILESQGAQSFILDLRGNPGGYLTQARDITSLFVSKGAVVQIEDRNGTTVDQVSGKTATNKPLVVLVNGDSASASELVTAALQDHKRATVVGERTYGKGTVQDIRELSWGGALKFTVAHYLSPSGRTLDGVGVTPDIIVAPADPETLPTPSLTDNITSSDYLYNEGIDLQLDAALSVLEGSAGSVTSAAGTAQPPSASGPSASPAPTAPVPNRPAQV